MIFVDTGPFLARHVSRDQYHARAVRSWKELERGHAPVFTSSFVLDEMLTLLARRASAAFAAERAEAIWASKVLTILRPDAADEGAALVFLRKLSDKDVSFTDCVSFALMRRHRLTRAFTFDRHFADAGFAVWP